MRAPRTPNLCPLRGLSAARTILLIVYDNISLPETVKSQKSDRGRRYSAFRRLTVPQPNPPRGTPRRHKSGLRSRITPRKRVSDNPTDTTYHKDTRATQYGDFDRPPAAPSAPRSLSGHCGVTRDGTGARHCSTPRSSEGARLRRNVGTARTAARHDSRVSHVTTHARHTSCDCGATTLVPEMPYTSGQRRPGVPSERARDAPAMREQRAAALAAGSSRRRSQCCHAAPASAVAAPRSKPHRERDRIPPPTTSRSCGALTRRPRRSGRRAEVFQPPGDAPARRVVTRREEAWEYSAKCLRTNENGHSSQSGAGNGLSFTARV